MKQGASRKKKNTKNIKQFIERISNEYRFFYYSMMEKEKKEIFESCDKIKFYICVAEYFEENDNVSKEAIKKLKHTKHPLEELWMYYLGHEYISVSSWEDIDGLLACYSSLIDIYRYIEWWQEVFIMSGLSLS